MSEPIIMNFHNFYVCIRFLLFFPPKTKETNVKECNEKTTTWTTRTIKERQFRMRTKSFYLFFEKLKKNLAFQRDKRDVVVVVVVTFVPQSFMWRCRRSFRCSHSRRLPRVVHRTPTTTTTKASICVLSKLRWRLYKRMHLLFSSQNLHITKLRLVT